MTRHQFPGAAPAARPVDPGAAPAASSADPAASPPVPSADDGFVRACPVGDLPHPEGALGVEVDGTPVAVVRAGGEVYALRDVCSHAEVPLSEGEIYDHTLECWLHGSCFDVRTGEPTGPPATEPVPVYPVRIADGDVYVALGGGAGRTQPTRRTNQESSNGDA